MRKDVINVFCTYMKGMCLCLIILLHKFWKQLSKTPKLTLNWSYSSVGEKCCRYHILRWSWDKFWSCLILGGVGSQAGGWWVLSIDIATNGRRNYLYLQLGPDNIFYSAQLSISQIMLCCVSRETWPHSQPEWLIKYFYLMHALMLITSLAPSVSANLWEHS